MGNAHRQQGMTLIGWIIVLALIGFFVLLAFRLVPVYLEAYSVGSVLRGMQAEGRLAGNTRAELRRTFERRLNINEVDVVSADDLEFSDVPGGTQLVVEYEERVPFAANISIVASFRKETVVRN